MRAQHGTAAGPRSRGLAGSGSRVLSPLAPLRAGNSLSYGVGAYLLLSSAPHCLPRMWFAMRSIWVSGGLCKTLLARSVSNAAHSRSVKTQLPGTARGVPSGLPLPWSFQPRYAETHSGKPLCFSSPCKHGCAFIWRSWHQPVDRNGVTPWE